MMLKLYLICLVFVLSETAQLGLHSIGEQSSLKSEVTKYKTAECGGHSSSEELENTNRKQSKNKKRTNNTNRKESDESDDESESEEKSSKKNRRNNNQHRQNYEQVYFAPMFDRYPYQDRRNTPPQYYPYMNNRNYHNYDQNQNQNQNRPFNQYPNRNEEDFHGNRDGDLYPNRNPNTERRDQFENRRNEERRNKNEHRNHYNTRKNERRGYDNKTRNIGRNNNRKSAQDESIEDKCVSQCVFNNMEIMENDGIPSESALINFAQNKIKNEKLKNAAIKEIRKCFGTLSSTDTESSCNFSKSVNACLKLDLEDDEPVEIRGILH